VAAEVEGALGAGDHAAGLRALAALAAPLDRFFVDVMVMCEDPALRQARLGLLARLEGVFLRLADLSRLGGATA
jgi:glycyl-tRNA synthetase beta chain